MRRVSGKRTIQALFFVLASTPFVAPAQNCSWKTLAAIQEGCGQLEASGPATSACFKRALKAVNEGEPTLHLVYHMCSMSAIAAYDSRNCITAAANYLDDKLIKDVASRNPNCPWWIAGPLEVVTRSKSVTCVAENLKHYVNTHPFTPGRSNTQQTGHIQ